MNRTLVIIIFLVLGYLLGAKFPMLAQVIGFA